VPFLIVFANGLLHSGGTYQLLFSWWWCIVKNESFHFSVADPVPTYRCALWVTVFDRLRITLIMWNLRLLIESKSTTNIKSNLENSTPIGKFIWRGKQTIKPWFIDVASISCSPIIFYCCKL
jgi:hypothetical protein